MKRKQFFFLLVIASVFYLQPVAAKNYYYETGEDTYKLCLETEEPGKYNCAVFGKDEIDQINSDAGVITQGDETYEKSTSAEPVDWGDVSDIKVEEVCNEPGIRKPLKLIGTFVMLLKILIPILIILLGGFDLLKVITSSKQDGINKAAKSIAVRVVAGIAIFFLPGIIQMVLNWVNEWSNYENTWCCCTQCILDANNCDVNSCSSDSCRIGGMNS